MTFRPDWHGACKVAAFFVPLNFPHPLTYSPQSNVPNGYDTLGNCNATRLNDGLWYVIGIYLNKRMLIDKIPPIKYEALTFEENDSLEAQRYGTQYLFCSVAIDGIDRTGLIRPTMCGEGRYILEYKMKHNI